MGGGCRPGFPPCRSAQVRDLAPAGDSGDGVGGSEEESAPPEAADGGADVGEDGGGVSPGELDGGGGDVVAPGSALGANTITVGVVVGASSRRPQVGVGSPLDNNGSALGKRSRRAARPHTPGGSSG